MGVTAVVAVATTAGDVMESLPSGTRDVWRPKRGGDGFEVTALMEAERNWEAWGMCWTMLQGEVSTSNTSDKGPAVCGGVRTCGQRMRQCLCVQWWDGCGARNGCV